MDGTYAPQSPDLSSFLSSPPKTAQPYQPTTSTSTSYAPRSPVLPSFNSSSSAHHNLHAFNTNAPFSGGSGSDFAAYGTNAYMPPIPALPASHSFTSQSHQNQNQQQNTYFSPQRPARKVKNESFSYSELDADAEPEDDLDYTSHQTSTLQTTNMSSTTSSRRIKGEPSSTPLSNFPTSNQHANPNPHNIEIKTKFPVARIKRIMQADEEVGKVAQVTPVAVSKALELFMIALVSGAAEKAREKGGKKVSAQHLKSVVEGNPDQFDFLAEIVSRVGDGVEGAGGEGKKRKGAGAGKGDGGSDSSEEEKKVKKGRGRKKKGEE